MMGNYVCVDCYSSKGEDDEDLQNNAEYIIETCKQNLNSIINEPWYCGNIDRKEAVTRLKHEKDGTFMVRKPSKKGDCEYVVTVKKSSLFRHYKIFKEADGKYRVSNQKFRTVKEIISQYKDICHLHYPYKSKENSEVFGSIHFLDKYGKEQRITRRFNYDQTGQYTRVSLKT